MLFSDRDVFVTSDHPVVLANREIIDPSLNAPGTIVQLPISPTRLLIIGDRHFDDGKAYPLRDGGECDFNYLIFRSARRYLFSSWHPQRTLEGIVRSIERVEAEQNLLGAQVAASARAAFGRIGRNEPCPCGSGAKYKRCCGRE
jgi:hypothetical protein